MNDRSSPKPLQTKTKGGRRRSTLTRIFHEGTPSGCVKWFTSRACFVFRKGAFVPSSAERFCAGPVRPNRRTKPQAIASTYFHRRVTHLTALRVLRLGAWSAVMEAHHKGRATTSVRARKAARRVAFRGHRRASTPLDDVQTSSARRLLPGGREKRSYVSSSYESKYWAMTFGFAHRLGQTWLAAKSVPFMNYPG